MKKYLSTALLCLLTVLSCNKQNDMQELSSNVVISKEVVNIQVGETVTVSARVLPEALGMDVVWSVLDADIASVEDGRIVGKAEGVTYVVATAADGASKSSCMVSVDPPARYRIVLKDAAGLAVKSVSGYPGYTAQFFPFTSDGITSHKFTWSVEDNSVASVTNNGEITFKAVPSAVPDYVYYGATNLVITTEDEDCRCTIPIVGSVCKGISLSGKFFPGTETAMVPVANQMEMLVAYGSPESKTFIPNGEYSLELDNTTDFSIDSSSGADVLVTGTTYNAETKILFSLNNVNEKVELATVKTEQPLEITDFASLKGYLDKVVEGTAAGLVSITKNIDLTPDEAADLPCPANFKGTIDGNDHSIGGLIAPLFKSMTEEAYISNLTLDVDIETAEANIGAFAVDGGGANFVKCVVEGTIVLSGIDTEDLHVGGFVGTGDSAFKDCTNKASITVASGSITKGACVAGFVGYGTLCSFNGCRNEGAITMQVETGTDLQIGGIVSGDIETAMDKCTNAGPIKVESNVGKGLYIGGLVGFTRDLAPLTNLINETKGTITCDDITIGGQLYVGGVIGGERDNVEVTHSKLVNNAAITLGSSGMTTPSTSYSYIGGVSGGSGDTRTTYEYCENYGNISYFGEQKCRCGGVVGYSYNDLVSAKCKADIRFVSKKSGSTAKSDVGGIVGYLNAVSITGHLYVGNINTNSSSPRAYTGGIIGRHNSNDCTISNCRFGGSVKGAGSAGNGTDNCVAFICCAGSKHKIDLVNCIIESGSKRFSTKVTKLVMNYSSTATDAVMVTGTTSATGTTTLNPASTGEMTNCTIGAIE